MTAPCSTLPVQHSGAWWAGGGCLARGPDSRGAWEWPAPTLPCSAFRASKTAGGGVTSCYTQMARDLVVAGV